MDVSSRARSGWRLLKGPEPWSRRRVGGEAALAFVLALMTGGTGLLVGGPLRAAAVTVAVVALSLLRRSLPASVLLGAAALAMTAGEAAPLLMVAAWSAGRHILGAGRALAAFTAAFVIYQVLGVITLWPIAQPVLMGVFSTLFFLAVAVVPGLTSRYWSQRRTLLRAMQEHNAQLLRERAMVAGQARLRERQRIAQDMHDSLGHQLALISVHTGALEVDPELTGRQREAVGVLRQASVAAMHELREVVGILRDGVEAPGAPDAAQPAARGTAGIQELVTAARAAGNTVELRAGGEPRPLAAAADHAAYRIVQEALTNAYKHAPGAPITVELRYEPDSFVVEVVNGVVDRTAADQAGEVVSGGQGLTGLHERARLVGGMVHTGPTDDGGFRVAGVLPYGAAEAATFVDAPDDFRQQSPAPPLGDGGPVMDWNIAEKELGMSGRNRAGGVALGCGIAVGALVLLAIAAGVGLFFLAGSAEKGMIDPSQYERIKVGASEAEVRDALPSGDTVLTSGLAGKGPAAPEASQCLVLMSSETGDSLETEPVFRFCFKDGKLIEKKSYEVAR
ncbi:sensor histidine kinase [Streptomyces sp. SDr-06]|uniref:sensor histidine kinase n=1 Tax=Streptomyces sp. SDr-06 TaxID=2267702 RepID=UPI001CB9D334|nr:histidine kinase [Streptomyces sp. SDr-06]